jgi:hypothetical protein
VVGLGLSLSAASEPHRRGDRHPDPVLGPATAGSRGDGFAAQSLASGDDVRGAYWNGSGWVELDRLLDDESAWNNAAQMYHQAVLGEIESGRHSRLGDAILAAQSAYADSGAFPELLSIYHLFGDPSMKVR